MILPAHDFAAPGSRPPSPSPAKPGHRCQCLPKLSVVCVTERGCVVLDQPQQLANLLRLVRRTQPRSDGNSTVNLGRHRAAAGTADCNSLRPAFLLEWRVPFNVEVRVKQLFPAACAALLLAGCMGSSVTSRIKERPAAYAALPPDIKSLVDSEQIRVGMSADAVFLAWGKPAQILQSENESGAQTVWQYWGGWMEETRYWAYRQVGRDSEAFLERYLVHDYEPRTYLRAELVFVDGKLKEWHTLAQPPS